MHGDDSIRAHCGLPSATRHDLIWSLGQPARYDWLASFCNCGNQDRRCSDRAQSHSKWGVESYRGNQVWNAKSKTWYSNTEEINVPQLTMKFDDIYTLVRPRLFSANCLLFMHLCVLFHLLLAWQLLVHSSFHSFIHSTTMYWLAAGWNPRGRERRRGATLPELWGEGGERRDRAAAATGAAGRVLRKNPTGCPRWGGGGSPGTVQEMGVWVPVSKAASCNLIPCLDLL